MTGLKSALFKGTARQEDPTPFTIAEMSGNHNGSLDKALAIVDAIATTGADAVKIQTYTPETMTLDIAEGEFKINDAKSLWNGRTLFDLYEEAHTPWDWRALGGSPGLGVC